VELGKYQIFEELGRGAFATVYRALDTTLDREVALKILHPQLLTDPTFVERFKREARAMANLDHQHIATVYEIGEAEERVYIAMQLARGPDLGQAIDEHGRLSWKQALALLRPVCEALDYAHSRDIVHRDLKPSNVLLDKERGPMLTDFGFARLMGDSSVSLSLSGGILGTPAYIAPEVWELDKAEPPADIYALGCILYEMLIGEVLFAGKTPMQALRAHDRGPQFPQERPEDVPEGIEAVLEKALARDPEERFSNGMALWHALNDLEAKAQAAKEAAELEAVAAQWREETEAAMAAGEWSVAKMAAARWLAVAPNDPDAQEAQAEIERQLEGPSTVEEEKEEEEAEEPVEDTVACPACGHANRPDAQYCRACGQSLEAQTEPESEPPPDIETPQPEEKAAGEESEALKPAPGTAAPRRSSRRKGVPSWVWIAGGIVGVLVIGCCLVTTLSGVFKGKAATPTPTKISASEPTEAPIEPTESSKDTTEATETLKLGVLGPFSGPSARTGDEFKASATMALEEIDYQIGHYEIEPVWIDSQSDPAKASQAYEQAVVQDGIEAGVLNWHSSVAVSCMEVTAKYQVPHLFGFGATSVVNETFNSNSAKYGYWMFKGWPTPKKLGISYVQALEYAIGSGHWEPEEKTVAIYGEDTDWGRSFGNAIKEQFQNAGWEVVGEEYFDIDKTEFYPLLNEFKEQKPSVIAGTNTAASSFSAFIRQAEEVGLRGLIIADGLGWIQDWYDLTGRSSNYVLDQIPGWATDEGKAYAEQFEDRFGITPSPSSGGA
jgi:branched-chain amino acid transport system substrate-binding protein